MLATAPKDHLSCNMKADNTRKKDSERSFELVEDKLPLTNIILIHASVDCDTASKIIGFGRNGRKRSKFFKSKTVSRVGKCFQVKTADGTSVI